MMGGGAMGGGAAGGGGGGLAGVAGGGGGSSGEGLSGEDFRDAARRKCSITSNVSTMRVLSVLRHWVAKHTQDFETNPELKSMTIGFLESILCTPTLLPSEHRASSQLLRMLTKEGEAAGAAGGGGGGAQSKISLAELLTPVPPSQVSF